MKKFIFLFGLYVIFFLELAIAQANDFTVKKLDSLALNSFELADYVTAFELYKKVCDAKTKELPKDNPATVYALIKLAHTGVFARKYLEARAIIKKALKIINENPGKHSKNLPYALFVNGFTFEGIIDVENADKFYSAFYSVFKKDKNAPKKAEYLDALVEMAEFYATNIVPGKAFEYAHLAYDYSKQDQFDNSTVQLKCIRNLSNIYFGFGNYKKGLEYSEEGLQLFYKNNKKNTISRNKRIKLEKLIPYLMWVNVKSNYYLTDDKTEGFLQDLLNQINKGVEILDRRKSILLNQENVHLLLADYNLFFSFVKRLNLDLYNKTSDFNYLNRVINIHESNLYTRIRTRLNTKEFEGFANLPISESKREKKLANNLAKVLYQSEKSDNFIQAQQKWSEFLHFLKVKFPRYYKLKYESIEQSLNDFQQKIPSDQTIIRYLFIEKRLYAFIVSQTEKFIVPLTYINLKLYIYKLKKYANDEKEISSTLFTIYNSIWKPFEDKIKTENIVIIPDGDFFNISFEMLTPTKISSFKELKDKSLLSKYNISYNYSLFLINKDKASHIYKNNFIAFTPEFTYKMKGEYKIGIKDSINLDNAYLTLLPQPFSKDMAKKYSRMFDGTSFSNSEASKYIFANKAKEHKIIHIGTHAEANNSNPELSRLIFAKNISDSAKINDNSLYTYEIYNHNLSSNLAILTACETGKTAYQGGEGMISLAHAFNYAGSESILTSLWEIDEQSSMKIVDSFYGYLSDGMSKDKALRLAKLNYISEAEGRTLSPQYWGGLVLLGNTSSIEISASKHWLIWLTALLLIIFGVSYFFLKNYFNKNI